jgi:hypothetical protein
MLNLYDDSYESNQYSCCSCDHKDFLLKEAACEVSKVLESVIEMRKSQASIENQLLNNLENACHMVGIPFKWS